MEHGAIDSEKIYKMSPKKQSSNVMATIITDIQEQQRVIPITDQLTQSRIEDKLDLIIEILSKIASNNKGDKRI